MPTFPKPRVQGHPAAVERRFPLTPERRAMIAKVHVAKMQLQIEDAEYRAILQRVAQTGSSASASDAALHRLLAEFARLGFKSARPGSAHSDKPNVRKLAALWADLAPYVADSSAEALRSFVRRQTRTAANPDGVSAPEFLDGKQANRVIEGLKAWLKRVREGGGHVA